MKPGDLVTPINTGGRPGSAFFRLWADYTGKMNPQDVNDRFYTGELGLIMEIRDHAGYRMALVLSPRGRSGWLSVTNLEVVQ